MQPQTATVLDGKQTTGSKLYTKYTKELILDLVNKKVDFVVLDNLGYSSTYLYLYPAIQAYPQYFPQAVMHYDNTHQYLLRFDRTRAARELNDD